MSEASDVTGASESFKGLKVLQLNYVIGTSVGEQEECSNNHRLKKAAKKLSGLFTVPQSCRISFKVFIKTITKLNKMRQQKIFEPYLSESREQVK